MKHLRALIFDLDGVIVDTEALHAEAKKISFERFGINVPENLYAEFRGRSDQDMVEHVVERYGRSSLSASEVLASKHEVFLNIRERMPPVEGAIEFIRLAHGHYERLAVATSATVQNQRFAFDRFGLEPFFEVVVTSEDVSRTKPHPDPYLKTLEKLGMNSESCLVIEDSCHGILSAKAAGCRVAALTTSFSKEVLVGAEPDHIVSDFVELATLLELPVCGSTEIADNPLDLDEHQENQ